jgi:hypothetical protein
VIATKDIPNHRDDPKKGNISSSQNKTAEPPDILVEMDKIQNNVTTDAKRIPEDEGNNGQNKRLEEKRHTRKKGGKGKLLKKKKFHQENTST